MELRKISLCLALMVIASLSQCSEGKHVMHRRDADDDIFDDSPLNDEAANNDTQNDETDADDDDNDIVTMLTRPTVINEAYGSSVRLECQFTSTNSNPVVFWRKDNKNLVQMFGFTNNIDASYKDRIVVDSKEHSIILRDLTGADSGRYTCEIQGPSKTSVDHELIVPQIPLITNFTSNSTYILEGDYVLLICNVTGFPKPNIIWTRYNNIGNGRLQENDGKFVDNTLLLENITKEQAGTYYCYVMNSYGNATSKLDLKVHERVHVHVPTTEINSDVNIEAILECYVHNAPSASINWYKDNVLIPKSSGKYIINTDRSQSNLTVIPESENDFGTFTCVADNSHSTHSRSIKLVQSPVISELDVDGLKLSFDVSSHQPLDRVELQIRPVEEDNWQVIDVPVPSAEHHKYHVAYVLDENIVPGPYAVAVHVTNNRDVSRITEPEIVQIDREGAPAEDIQQDQVIRAAGVVRGGASAIRPETALLSAVLIYLLVRM